MALDLRSLDPRLAKALSNEVRARALELLVEEASSPKLIAAELGLDLRAGGGARYQLALYPLQDKAQIRKVRSDGSVEYLDIEKKVPGIGGAEKPNQLRLRAFNVTSGEEKGTCQLSAYLGGKLVAEASDPTSGELSGRASGFSLGSAKVAKGAQASVDDVVVSVPGPF